MQPTNPPSWWTDNLEVVDTTVDVSNLDKSLADFLVAMGEVHRRFSDLPLMITSGNDGNHAQGSKHYMWKAVDIRSRDLKANVANVFAHEMIDRQEAFKVGIFDERFIGAPHWHVETA